MMRLLLVGAGASYSTRDVELGYLAALRAAGHQVVHYALDGRIAAAGGFLRYSYRQAKKAGSLVSKPTPADTLYLAGQGILERALRFQVDWVLLVSGMYVLPDVLVLLRRAGLRTALLFTESPYDDAQQASLAALADVCFTNERTSVPVLREACRETHSLPHAYNPAKHGRFATDAENEAPAHDVVFIGTGFAERIDTLAAVDWAGLGIDLGLYGTWELLGSRHRLRRFVRGGVVPNTEAMALCKAAKITLNLYRTSRGFGRWAPRIEAAESLNPRTLELAASGVFHLSDWRPEVEETFGVGEGALVPTFRTRKELARLVQRWLPEAAERQEIAARLPACVEGRTYDAMAQQIVMQLTGAAMAVAA
jgi:spore maturation protein CgeB